MTHYAATVYGYPLVALGFAALLVAGLSPACGRLRIPGARLLAELAFCLYLVHKPIIHLLHRGWLARHGLAADGCAALAICLAASLAAATLLRAAVEKPGLRLRRRFEAQRMAALSPTLVPSL